MNAETAIESPAAPTRADMALEMLTATTCESLRGASFDDAVGAVAEFLIHNMQCAGVWQNKAAESGHAEIAHYSAAMERKFKMLLIALADLRMAALTERDAAAPAHAIAGSTARSDIEVYCVPVVVDHLEWYDTQQVMHAMHTSDREFIDLALAYLDLRGDAAGYRTIRHASYAHLVRFEVVE